MRNKIQKYKTEEVRSKNGRVYQRRVKIVDKDGNKIPVVENKKTRKPPKEESVDLLDEVLAKGGNGKLEIEDEVVNPIVKGFQNSTLDTIAEDKRLEEERIRRTTPLNVVEGSIENPIAIRKFAREIDDHLVRLYGRDYFIAGEITNVKNKKRIRSYLVKVNDFLYRCHFDVTSISFSI